MFVRHRFLLPWIGSVLLVLSFLLLLDRSGDGLGVFQVHSGGFENNPPPPINRSPSKNQGLSANKNRANRALAGTASVRSGVPAMPVGFLLAEISPNLLTDEEDSAVHEAQEKFTALMARSAVSDTASPEYHRQWGLARLYCDDLIRLRLGADGFNRMNFLAAQETERMKKP